MCVSGRASRRNLQRSFLCRNSTDVGKPRPMRSQIFTLNNKHFTHQLFEIVRPVIWNAEDEIVSPVHTKCFQHCAPVQTRQHRMSLETMIVESFLHVCRKHFEFASRIPWRLLSNPDLALLAKVLWWHHVDHLAHFPMEERHRNVKHNDDHQHVCPFGSVPEEICTWDGLIKPQHLLQTNALMAATTSGEPLARTPFLQLQDKIEAQLSQGLLQTRPPWRKPHASGELLPRWQTSMPKDSMRSQ